MTIEERKKYAEQKRDEAFSNGSLQSICYWDGYIAALKDIKASEVASEIFAELDKRLDDITIVMGRLDSLRTFHKTMEKVTAEVAELKKKYTEGEG